MQSAVGSLLGFQKTASKMSEVLTSGLSPEVSVDSATMQHLYQGCLIRCVRGEQTGCECLSNLCVLQMYSSTATACDVLESWFYNDATKFPALSTTQSGAYSGLPWIMYAGGAYAPTAGAGALSAR